MKVYLEADDIQKAKDNKDDNGIVAKTMKKMYSTLKTKLVALLTGQQVLNNIGTILDVLTFLHIMDRKKADEKMKQLTGFMQAGVENTDQLLAKIPLLEEMFGEEKEFINKAARFLLFSQQVSIGAYPAENFDMSGVVLTQSTLIACIVLCIVTGGAIIYGTFGIGLDLMCTAYNKVFKTVEPDIVKFEKWLKEQGKDAKKMMKELKPVEKQDKKQKTNNNQEGNEMKQAAESTKKARWHRIDEGLLSGLAKLGAKAIGKAVMKGGAKTAAKGAAKATTKAVAKGAAKGAKTVTGKIAQKMAPLAKKGLRKGGAKILKSVRKLSPKTAQFLKKNGKQVAAYLASEGLGLEDALAYVGDYISDAVSTAKEQDKKVLDVIKEDLGSAKTKEELVAKVNDFLKAMGGGGNEDKEKQATAESRISWIPLEHF